MDVFIIHKATSCFFRLLEEFVNVEKAYQQVIEFVLENRHSYEQLRYHTQPPALSTASYGGSTVDMLPSVTTTLNVVPAPISLPPPVGIRYV